MSEIDLEKVKNVALEAADLASKEIVKAFYKDKNVENKEGVANLVTETDTKCELLIIEHLKKSFPDFKIISEETNDSNELTDGPTWCIDPVDGTTNFVHSYPFIAVSIGFLLNKEPVIGVVANPIINETYYAIKGKGAYRNNEKIHVSKVKELKDSLIATNFPSGMARTEKNVSHLFQFFTNVLEHKIHGIRTSGSAVMNLVGVACGRLECYFEKPLGPWDMCAGTIIVQEAGGIVTALDGNKFNVMEKNIIASNISSIHKEIISLLK